MDVMLSQRPLEHAVSHIQNDFTASWLGCTQRMNPYLSPQLGEYIHTLAKTHDVVLVEAKVDATHNLPLPLLNDGVIVIQMNEKAASVKQAYSLIKQLHQKLDKAAFGILVHGRTAKNANQVFANVAKVARQFLGINLDDMGFIPTENPLAQPYKTSNNVSHARPSAGIANIYHEIAKRLLRQPLTLTALDTTPTI
jgi:flagellar biosynthesis protein FlhG